MDKKRKQPLYISIYEGYREDILRGRLPRGQRLPSLRALAAELGVSVTTVSLAYSQLQVEGYIYSRPNSGYYVEDVGISSADAERPPAGEAPPQKKNELIYDATSFDFRKWRQCLNAVINDYYPLLLREGEAKGEYMLRQEIARYVFDSRGVNARADQIVVGAGTGQLTRQLTDMLRDISIEHVALEDPGYKPVSDIFAGSGLAVTRVPVLSDGIDTDKLPTNISCAAYVSPSNQFPTGAVMPVGKRRGLLSWAEDNDSLIIEDDYDSELRYFGRPIPAMQGMDKSGRVIYLGSFSATLYPAIKVSYMILPDTLSRAFDADSHGYTQTCSVAEQIALALFMKNGYYIDNIRKQRRLYSQKLTRILACLKGTDISPQNTASGLSLILKVRDPDSLSEKARDMGLEMTKLPGSADSLVFYYNRIPLEDIPRVMEKLLSP